jgi:multiple sugar transport system permease protein
VSLTRKEAILGYCFIAPWLVGFFIWTLGPMVASFVLSFADYAIIAPPEFLGLTNYRKILSDDPAFWDALRVTLTYALFSVPAGIVASLGIALLMNQSVPGLRIWRTIYYLPAVVSGVAVAMLWIWVFHSEFGAINLALRLLGLRGPGWLGDPDWALWALVLMSFWGVGAGMVIKLAGLQGIPSELYEAASIDGANRWAKFWHVTWPLISPTTFFLCIIGIIGLLVGGFDLIWTMTKGGPLDASTTIVIHIFRNAFVYYDMGYASAMAYMLFLVILALTIIQWRLQKRWVHYS